MARYCFDVEDGVCVRDDVGRELPGLEAARREAVRLASEYAREPANLGMGGVLVVSVRDEEDAVVVTVRLVCQIETTAAA